MSADWTETRPWRKGQRDSPTRSKLFGGIYRPYGPTSRRRACPFVSELQYRRFKDASRLLKLAQLCLAELRHQRALSLAPFKPGAQIRVHVTMPGYVRAPQRYLVFDAEWRKGDENIYVVHELTKQGRLHKGRYRTWVCPSNLISIEPCTEPLDQETVHHAESARPRAKARRSEVLEKGSLALFDEALKRP